MAQLRTLVNWYKCDGDTAVCNIKHLLLEERLDATECRGDAVEPPLPSAHSSSLQEQVEAPATIGAQAADEPSGEEQDDSVLAASGALAVPLIC